MINVRHCLLIEHLFQAKTLARAAQALHLTPSALSHQLRELEDQLGITLFDRVGKKLLPTQAGRRVLASSQVVLQELKRLDKDLKVLQGDPTQTVRLSTSCYTAYYWLPGLMQQFAQSNPYVHFQVVAEATRRPMEALQEGGLDLAITNVALANPGFISERLFEDEWVAVLSQTHPLAQQTRPLTAVDFQPHTYICYQSDENENTILRNFFRANGIFPAKVLQIALTEAIIEMVSANLGVTIMASWAVKPYLQTKAIAVKPIEESVSRRTWYGVYRPHSAPIMEEICRYIREKNFANAPANAI